MKLKSYFSSNVEGALRLARMELGPDAMIVQSRRTAPEARHLGECEVVVALTAAATRMEMPPAAPAPKSGLADEVADLRRRLDRIARSSLRTSGPGSDTPEAVNALLSAGVVPELAQDIYRGAVARGGATRDAIAAELESRFEVNPKLGRITALVGPCGSGKTTTIAKLAATHGIAARRPTLLVSMDSWRIGGAEQLRSLATILGLPFVAPERPAALSEELEKHRSKALILIDTPGYSEKDMDVSAELADLLSSRPDIDVHLTLTASMKAADLTRVVDRFGVFRPARLLFTRLDETGTFGPLLSEAERTALPVSFMSTGQQVPEDLEPASKARLIDLVLGDFGRDL